MERRGVTFGKGTGYRLQVKREGGLGGGGGRKEVKTCCYGAILKLGALGLSGNDAHGQRRKNGQIGHTARGVP